MQRIFCCLFLIATLGAAAQKKTGNPAPYAKTITAADLKKHLYIIAGAGMEGRGTGTPGLERAALYIENQFKQVGLQPGYKGGYQYYYPLYQDSMEKAWVKVGNTNFEPGRHFNGNLRQGINNHVNGDGVVFMGYGIDDPAYSDYKGKDVKGKIVMVMEGEPKKNDTAYMITGTSKRSNWAFISSLKQKAAADNGAIAILVINNNFPKYNPARKITRGPLYPDFEANKNAPIAHLYNVGDTLAMAIVGDARLKELKDDAKAGKPLAMNIIKKDLELHFAKKRFETRTSNVVGLLPGTDLKDEYVVITGHMDHLGKKDSIIYYGADDDGSGTCAVMEIAEAFMAAKKAGKGPRRSILFMTVSGEEMGLWGSEYYTKNPIFPLEKTTVDLNIDMIGRMGSEYTAKPGKPGDADSLNYVYVIGDDKLSSDLRPISEMANKGTVDLKLDYKYNDPKDPNRFYYRSDHYNFAEKGVPIIFYFNGVHNDYHRPTDTPDKISYDLYARRAQLVFYTGWLMANRDAMLKRDIPLNMPGR
jgi:hypothetical protein